MPTNYDPSHNRLAGILLADYPLAEPWPHIPNSLGDWTPLPFNRLDAQAPPSLLVSLLASSLTSLDDELPQSRLSQFARNRLAGPETR